VTDLGVVVCPHNLLRPYYESLLYQLHSSFISMTTHHIPEQQAMRGSVQVLSYKFVSV